MSVLRETFAAMREESQTKRAGNRVRGLRLLEEAGIPFEMYSSDHVFVAGFHYWPSTGLFINADTGKRGRGIRRLLMRIEHREVP